jgi:hypothetical protein
MMPPRVFYLGDVDGHMMMLLLLLLPAAAQTARV